MSSVLFLAAKDLRLLWRDKAGLFWVLAFPLIYGTLFGAIMGGSSGGGGGRSAMKIGVVDEDGGPAAVDFVEQLSKSAALAVSKVTRAEGEDSVRRGDLVAYVVVRRGFTNSPMRIFAGESSTLEVGIDPSRRAEAGYLQGLLTETVFGGMQSYFSDSAKMRAEIKQALDEVKAEPDLPAPERAVLTVFFNALDAVVGSLGGKGSSSQPAGGGWQMGGPQIEMRQVAREARAFPHSGFEISFPSSMMWGILGCTAAFAISIVQERQAGTMLRLRVSPLTRPSILAGKALACFLTSLAVLALMTAVGTLAFGVRLQDPVGLLLSVFCTAFCFVGLMMAISVIGRSEQAVAGAGWAIMLVLAMFGGGMMPLFFMPEWLQKLSAFDPVAWAIYGLEGALWRGLPMRELLRTGAVLVGFGLAFFGLGVGLLRRVEA